MMHPTIMHFLLATNSKQTHTHIQPAQVAVGDNGLVYIADGYCNKRVAVYDPTANEIRAWRVMPSNVGLVALCRVANLLY